MALIKIGQDEFYGAKGWRTDSGKATVEDTIEALKLYPKDALVDVFMQSVQGIGISTKDKDGKIDDLGYFIFEY